MIFVLVPLAVFLFGMALLAVFACLAPEHPAGTTELYSRPDWYSIPRD